MPMGIFTKAAGQMTIEMASAFFGILMAPSVKVIIRIVIGMVSKSYIRKLLETQLMPNIKMVSQKDYTHYIHQMISFGTHIQNIKNTALRFCKTMI